MNEVVLVGIEYDDFGEGGFSVVAIGSNITEAKKLAEEYKEFFLAEVEKYPGAFAFGADTKPPKLSFRPTAVGVVLDI